MIQAINGKQVDENGNLEGEPLYGLEPQNYRRENEGRETRNFITIK